MYLLGLPCQYQYICRAMVMVGVTTVVAFGASFDLLTIDMAERSGRLVTPACAHSSALGG